MNKLFVSLVLLASVCYSYASQQMYMTDFFQPERVPTNNNVSHRVPSTQFSGDNSRQMIQTTLDKYSGFGGYSSQHLSDFYPGSPNASPIWRCNSGFEPQQNYSGRDELFEEICQGLGFSPVEFGE